MTLVRQARQLARMALVVGLAAGLSATRDSELAPAASPDLSIVALAAAGVAGVRDGRARFRAIYCAARERHGRTLPDDRPCETALRRAADEPAADGPPAYSSRPSPGLRLLVVSGIYGGCVGWLAEPFDDAVAHLVGLGHRAGQIPVDARSGSARNADLIRDHLAASPPAAGERLVLVGYSKGIADILEALVAHAAVREVVDAVVSIGGAVGGSPLADDLADPLRTVLSRASLPGCDPGDEGGLESLRREVRRGWLAANRLPDRVRYYSVAAVPGPDRVSTVLRPSYRRLAALDPRNDSQVLWSDAVIPGGTLLGYADADHWAAALPLVRSAPPGVRPVLASLLDRNDFPREVLLEAVVRYVGEDLAGVEGEG